MLMSDAGHHALPDGTPRLRDAIYNEILIAAAVKSSQDNSVTQIADYIHDYGLEAWL